MTSKVVYSGDLRTSIEHCKSGQVSFTDAPIDNHGKGQAFSPTDLVATSLASCMITVVAIRAEEMGIDLKGSFANVQKHMESSPRRIGQIDIELYLKLESEPSVQAMFERIALSCPVAKSLNKELNQNVSFKYFG